MSTKTKVLELLEQSRGQSLSGEELARQLEVSRAAVWKAIRDLREAGYQIEAATNRGYCLCAESNVLSVQGMLPHLQNKNLAEHIRLYDTVESTNQTAKELAVAGGPHGTVVIADSQTGGRGRRGRSFYAPPGTGIYFSILLRPQNLLAATASRITAAAAVAVCQAIETVTGIRAEIKWVNDLLVDGKKVCGILTEAVTDFESGQVDWIVVGAGINLTTEDFPEELKDVAGSLLPGSRDGTLRNRMAAELINHLSGLEQMLAGDTFLKEYRSRSMILGREIQVVTTAETYTAKAIEIDSNGALIVDRGDGKQITLHSGEVRIAPLL